MSLGASAEGTSAECTETTAVVLESTLHEMQNKPQDSPQATPRLPIEGEPSECEWEVVESVVTAGRMIGTVETADPMVTDADVDSEKAVLGGKLVERACRVDEGDETDVDVDRTVLLGREPVERASGVDEGDGTERRDLQLQQTNLLCEETSQHNGNAEDNIPITNGLPLKGEWTVYPSGEMKNSNGSSGREVEPADSWNKSETLVTTSIELEDPDSGEIPCVCLGSTHWHVGDASNPGCQTDWSSGHVDGSRGLMDGIESHADASTGQTDSPSIGNKREMAENKTEIVSTHQIDSRT